MIAPLLAAVYEPFSRSGDGTGLRFAHGELLWVWPVATAALAAFFWWSWRRRRELISRFVGSRLLAQLTVGVSARRQKIRLLLLTLAVAAALLALTRPQWGYDWEEATQQGLDIVVAIDTSRSMLAADVRPDRFTRAKLAALDLMRLARADRLGLVAFAGDAFLHCPLTLDEEAFRQSLDVLGVGIISQGGTALTAAIESALSAFKAEGENHRILVLFTDGEDHESGIETTLDKARQAGLRIFTIGVGSAAGELLRTTDEHGVASFIKDAQGNAVKSRLNEPLLQQIATATGGFYLQLRGPETMETLYQKGLAPLPKSELSTRLFRQYHERFHWPLTLAILCLVAEMFLPDRRRAAHRAPPTAPRNPLNPAALACLACTVASLPTHAASASEALRHYQAGRFPEARRSFEELAQQDPSDRRLQFNAGAAAFREGRFDEATRSFSEAISAPDLDLQQKAFYNLGNSLYRLGERAPQPQARQQHWEKAVKQFESALQLDPADADARHNLDFVRQRLEELKQQQQQQQQQQQSPDKNQEDPQDQKDQSDSSQNKQDQSGADSRKQQESRDQQQQPSPGQDQQQQAESQSGKDPSSSEDKPQDQKQPQEQPGQSSSKQTPSDQQSQSQPAGQGEGKPGDAQPKTESPANAAALGQMTARQAEQLLDAQKGNEKAMIFAPAAKGGTAKGRILKDW